jgi:hypothetical protein
MAISHRRANRALARSWLALSLVLPALGCAEKEPERAIDFSNGTLHMVLSERWVLQHDAGRKAFYKLGGEDDVKLSFEDETEDFGQPLTVPAVKGMIGSELNLRYGSVNARLGLGGSAVLSYAHTQEDGNSKFYTQSWVVAKPFGHSAVARVAITLRVPEGRQNTPEFQALVETLDRQVGDARMREA